MPVVWHALQPRQTCPWHVGYATGLSVLQECRLLAFWEAVEPIRHVCRVQVRNLMRVLERPYEEQPGAEKYKVMAPKSVRMGVELLSCSS